MRTAVTALISGLSRVSILAAENPEKSWLVTMLLGFLTHFTYFALAGVLIIAGMGMPIPEDIPLVLSGYMCNPHHSPIKDLTRQVDSDGDGQMETVHRRIPSPYLMVVAGMVGILIGDTIVFKIGQHGIEGNNMVARHLRKVMNSKRRERVERHFAKHGNLTVFVARFAPGFRSIVFAFAGLSKMSYPRFLLIDGLAGAISVPVFIFLGYHFAEDINHLFAWMERIKHILLPVVLVLILGAITLYIVRRRRSGGGGVSGGAGGVPISAVETDQHVP